MSKFPCDTTLFAKAYAEVYKEIYNIAIKLVHFFTKISFGLPLRLIRFPHLYLIAPALCATEGNEETLGLLI